MAEKQKLSESDTIILSLHKRWWKKMLAGEKILEIRKTAPMKKDWEYRVLVYVIRGGGVCGEFICTDFMKIKMFPQLLETHKKQSCLTENQIREYAGESKRHLWGWGVTEVKEYYNPHPLNLYGLKNPPQSWCYYRGEEVPDIMTINNLANMCGYFYNAEIDPLKMPYTVNNGYNCKHPEQTEEWHNMATEFENILSKRSKKLKVKPQEFDAIRSLVNMLLGIGVEIKDFEKFFLSFTIEQIGKEFDLIKLDKDNLVLSIELKSEEVGVEAIQNQLEKNRYYLKHLAPDVRLYTFVETGKKLYKYTSKGLQLVGVEDLKDTMQLFQESLGENLESLFQANSYLISPLNSHQKFMYGDYFLTNQQHDIKKKIVDLILVNDKEYVLGIKGKAGTGKTLLLYDIIKEIAERGENCCLIHSGILCDGHRILSAKWDNVTIFSAKELNGDGVENLKRYQFIFVDESQRIYSSTFEKIIKELPV